MAELVPIGANFRGVSRAQRSVTRSVMVRCRPGIATNSEFSGPGSAVHPPDFIRGSHCTTSGTRSVACGVEPLSMLERSWYIRLPGVILNAVRGSYGRVAVD